MEGREAMSFPGGHPPPPFYFPRGAFTSISSPQSANALHAPPGFRPILNPTLQQQHPHLSNSGHLPFPFGEQQRHQDFTHGIHMGMAPSPTIQPPPPLPSSPVAATEMVVKKKRGRPKKNVPQVSLGLSPMPSSNKPNNSSSMSDPNESKRAGRGRPPGTGRKQRLANLGEWMNTSAGHAFTPHVISVEAGEDIVAKVLSISQQRPRVLCIMSGTGTVSSVTLCQSTSSGPSLSFQGHYDILSLGGSYLVNEEGGPKSRTGGISASLSHTDGYLIGGRVGTLIAASLVQVVACSFVYGSPKAKTIKQENGSKEDKNKTETPSSEPETPAAATESAGEGEAAQRTPEFSSPAMTTGWSGSGGGSRSTDSRNNNHRTDIDLTRG